MPLVAVPTHVDEDGMKEEDWRDEFDIMISGMLLSDEYVSTAKPEPSFLRTYNWFPLT